LSGRRALGEAGLHSAVDAVRREADILELIFTFSRRRDLQGGAEMEMEDQVKGPVVAGLRRSRATPDSTLCGCQGVESPAGSSVTGQGAASDADGN